MRRIELYKVKKGNNLADPNFWTDRFDDIDLRLHAREQDSSKIDSAVDSLTALALQRMADTFTPLIVDAQERLNALAASFSAESFTSLTIGTGEQIFTLTPESAEFYVYTDYINARSASAPTNSMVCRVVSFDRETGELVTDAEIISGSGTFNDWLIRVGTPPDAQHANRTDNPHSTTAAQVGAPTTAEMAAAIAAAINALPPLDLSSRLATANYLSEFDTDQKRQNARTNLALGALAVESLVGLGLLSSSLWATTAHILAGAADKVVKADALAAATAPVALVDAAPIALDLSKGVYFTVTLAGSRQLQNPTAHIVGRTIYIKVKQDGVGSRLLTYDTQYDFGQSVAPSLSTGANIEDLLAFFVSTTSKMIYLGIRKNVG